MFSLLGILAHWRLNPRRWLTWYLEGCAAARGKAPEDIEPFVPWNLSDERRLTLGGASHCALGPRHLLMSPVTPSSSPRA